MVEVVQDDQAAGLRRLLAQDTVRTMTLISGKAGIGKTMTAINLAVAFAKRGKKVVLLDQHRGGNNVAAYLGLNTRWDLLHVVQKQKRLDQVLLPGPSGVLIAPAAEAVAGLSKLSPEEQEHLTQSFASLLPAIDVILVDTPTGYAKATPYFTLATQELLVLVSGHPESITDAYALVKTLSVNFARRRFHIIVNRVKSTQQAETIFNNIAQVAKRYLDISLEYLGYIPEDDKLHRSRHIGQCVIEAFPTAPAAVACRRLVDEIEQWPYPGENCVNGFVQRLIHSSRMIAENLNRPIDKHV